MNQVSLIPKDSNMDHRNLIFNLIENKKKELKILKCKSDLIEYEIHFLDLIFNLNLNKISDLEKSEISKFLKDLYKIPLEES